MYKQWIAKLTKVEAYLNELETPVKNKKEWLDYLDMHEGLESVIKQMRKKDSQSKGS